jgi:hypothetical protein
MRGQGPILSLQDTRSTPDLRSSFHKNRKTVKLVSWINENVTGHVRFTCFSPVGTWSSVNAKRGHVLWHFFMTFILSLRYAAWGHNHSGQSRLCEQLSSGGLWKLSCCIGALQLAAILVDISKHVHSRTRIRHGHFFKMSLMRWACTWTTIFPNFPVFCCR